MKFWKQDTKLWTVRPVDGEPWPGKDAEGDTCYTNTHFETEEEAWKNLRQNAEAFISLACDRVDRARRELLAANENAAEATIAITTTLKNKIKRDAELKNG